MRVFSKLTALGILLSLAVTFSSSSADIQKAKKGRLSGNVRTVDKDKTEVTLRRGTADRIVIVGSNTKFNMQSGTSAKTIPTSIDEVKAGPDRLAINTNLKNAAASQLAREREGVEFSGSGTLGEGHRTIPCGLGA